jgi:hypothetical protein
MKTYLTIFVLLILSNAKAQDNSNDNCCQHEKKVPNEYISSRHTYQEVGEVDQHPFTMFNKDKLGWNLTGVLSEIRNRILNTPFKGDTFIKATDDYAIIYRDIYVSIKDKPGPSTCNYNSDCDHAKWVKQNAFLALIGLRYRWIYGMKDTFELINNQSEIDYFANNAKNGLSDLNPEIISCYGGEDCTNVHKKAFDLMQYLQAYDLLKAGGFIQNEENLTDCAPRNKLREFSKNLYVESNNIINSHTGWKRNHGIICASVLGMSAIVLNGAGASKFRYRYRPYNWHRRAEGTPGGRTWLGSGEDGLEDLFFVGNRNNFLGVQNCPQSSPNGKSGFAEGPHYFAFSMRAFLPFVQTKKNFLPHDNSYLKLEKYQNILKWFQNILNQDGFAPTYDNSKLDQSNILGILGDSKYPGPMPPLFEKLGNVDLSIDYILAQGSDAPISKEDYLNPESGNIILRTETENSNYTFHMLAEKDFAIDKPDYEEDNTHEEKDLGSFMIYAGTKNSTMFPLGIDPPYLGWSDVEYTNKYWMHNVIEIDNGLPAKEAIYWAPEISPVKFLGPNIKKFELQYDFNGYPNTIKRIPHEIRLANEIYYYIEDYIDATNVNPLLSRNKIEF